MKRSLFYAGVFQVCASVTALQIVETRLLSVVSYYYLAFLSISMAMFGMTAGAVWVYRTKGLSRDTLPGDLAVYASRYCLAVGACLLVQMSIPLATVASAMTFWLWLELALVLAVPFFFAGVVVTLALTRSQFPVGEVYAVDLLGAALGCLGALVLLQVLDAPSAILVLAAVAAIGASFFARSAVMQSQPANGAARMGRSLVALAGVLCAIAILNAGTVHGLQPVVVKGAIESRGDIEYEKWNSYSRIHVGYPVKTAPMLWSPSDRMPPGVGIWQRALDIDGSAYTNMFRFDGNTEDVSFLKYDVTNVAYAVRNTGRAAIIGVGGGRDVLSAWLFGFRDITGVELNPIFIDLLTRRQPFAAFAGLAGRPGIQFHVDEARSWFARTQERFDLIQMSMIDTWAATGAGAYTLSENGLYTVEGWRHFVDALTPTGVFTVSRWYGTGSIGETGRMVSLAARVLMDAGGVTNPEAHLALLANHNLATLILSRQPLTAAELTALHRVADEMNFEVVLAPDSTPGAALLGRIAKARDPIELAGITSELPFDLTPPHDDRPFFFNQLPLTSIWKLPFDYQDYASGRGVVSGNAVASLTLVLILVIAALLVTAVILVPLRPAIRDTNRRLVAAGSAYFLFLGIGFMFVEISLLQRFSLFLGHPVYSLSVALFAMILSTGIGSLVSEKLRLRTQTRLVVWAALLTLYLWCLPQWLSAILAALESSGILVRGAVAVAILMPAGLLMGFGFPNGMRMVQQQNPKPAPWFWGINGAAGVLGSILAVAVGITFGISASLHCGALCYAALLPAAFMLRPKASTAPAVAAASEAD
jgi:hypothetical protein